MKDFNKGIHIKKPLKLSPLPNIPEEKMTKNIISNENNKQNIIKNNINNSHSMNNMNSNIELLIYSKKGYKENIIELIKNKNVDNFKKR